MQAVAEAERAVVGGLYDPAGHPLYGSPPFHDPGDAAGGSRPFHFAVYPYGATWSGVPLGRVWLLPVDMTSPSVPPLVLADLVAAVDAGQSVIMHGADDALLRRYGHQVIAMTGGGHG